MKKKPRSISKGMKGILAKRILPVLLAVVLTVAGIPGYLWENEKTDIEVQAATTMPNQKIPEDAIVFNGHSYYVYNSGGESWSYAKEYCESLGGYLAVVSSQEENDKLFEAIVDRGYENAYFGYSDYESEGRWEWVPGEESTYTNWAFGEPNSESSDEDYAMFYWKFSTGKWNDGNFGRGTVLDDMNFICEWPGVLGKEESEDKKEDYPIIIVPGIMGSRLFTSSNSFNDSTKLWDPVVDGLNTVANLNKLKKNIQNEVLYVRPPEEQHKYSDGGTSSSYGREYGAQDTYKDIVDELCDTFPVEERKIYFFSYDWRKSNSISAGKLSKFITSLGVDKVDIVCHSMGGLVTSKYYSDYGEDKVNKIITCGTPYEGAPKLINCIENWDVIGTGASINYNNAVDFALATFGGLTKNVKKSFMGVTELTPTKNYVEKLAMQKDSWKPFNIGDYEVSTEQYIKICQEIFGKTNYNAAVEFQNSLHDSSGFNKLLKYDKAFFSIGVNHKTVSSIKFQYSNNDVDKRLYEEDLNYETLGDGTVPYYSSSISEQIQKLESTRWKTFDADHGETINKKKCRDWVINVLKSNYKLTNSDPVRYTKYKVVKVACPVDVEIKKNGETLQYHKDEIDNYATFGRMDILGENDEIKMFCLDDAGDYQVTLNGTDSGTMDYTIRYFDESNNLKDERIFEDVPITDKTEITTDLNLTGDTVLNIDGDNDGKIDSTWTAGKNEEISTPDPVVKNKKVNRVAVSGLSHKIAAGKRIQLKATVFPKNAKNKKLKWISSNTKVATVNQKGLVTVKPKTGGKTVIITAKATDGSGRKAVWKIKSMKGIVKKIKLSGKKKVKAGKALKLKARVKATKGANKKLKWISSNTKWAIVNRSGKVKTRKAGKGRKVKITAMATDGSGKKKTFSIKIK